MKGLEVCICQNVKGSLVSESHRLFIENAEFYAPPQYIEIE